MGHRSFVVVVLALCVAGFAGLLAFGRSPAYCRLSRTFADAAPCFQTDVRGQTAEVLLVGDSSLLYGIRPASLQLMNGVSTYNLGMPGPSFGFQAATLIDTYLARNARPRAIIVYFAPWDTISDRRITDPQWAPLGTYLLRHGTWGAIAHFIAVRPSAIVEVPELMVASFFNHSVRSDAFRQSLADERGFLDYPALGQRPLDDSCTRERFEARPASFFRPDNRAAIVGLKRRYAARGIPLFAYVAPIAQCDGAIGAVRRGYAGVADNLPVALPNENFSDDVKPATHVHASAAGVETLTRTLAEFINGTVRRQVEAGAR